VTNPIGPVRLTAAAALALVAVLHAPVFTQRLLVTPAGMHHAMWPWRANMAQTAASEAILQENHTLSDLLFEVYPWQLHITRTLAAGTIPLWNPHSYSGVPFLGNAQSAVLYPLHWPVWVIPSLHVFTAALLAKMVLAAIFMAIFLRGLGLSAIPCAAGAVSFALCGFMTSWLGYAHTNAAIFLPLLMHAARLLVLRPGANGFLLLAFAGAAQYLGGHPETSLHIMGVSFVYLLWNLRAAQRPLLSAGLYVTGAVLGFTMAAVHLFPFLEYLLRSEALAARGAGAGLDPTLPAESLAAWIMPWMYGRPEAFTWNGPAQFQAVIGYAGVGMLLLAALPAPRDAQPAFFRALAALCALVVYGPAMIRSALRHLPLVGITSNNRLLLVIAFAVAVLGASGLETILRRARDGAGAPGRGATLARLAAGATAIAMVTALLRGRDPAGARWAISIAIGMTILAALALLRPRNAAIYAAGALLVVCMDLGLFAWGFNPHADPAHLFPATPLTDSLRRDAAADMVRGGRLMTVGWVMRPETHMVYRLHSIEGYDAMENRPYQRLLERAAVDAIHQTGLVPDGARPLLDLAGLRYLVTPPGGVVGAEAMTLAYDGPDGRVFVNEQARPRFAFVGSARATREGEDALEMLATRQVDAGQAVLLEEAPAAPDAAGADAAPARTAVIALERATSETLSLSVKGHGAPGWLVVADAWYPGWEARVNGAPAPVLKANGVFRAVPIPSDDVELTMRYRPASFRVGLWVSALSLLATLAVGIARWGRR
jgi:hypothetical protein